MQKSQALEPRFAELVAREVGCTPRQVAAADALFADGATVPFVARYRKEATGGLDDAAVETIAKRRDYFLELAERRDAILASVGDQGKLTAELEAALRAAVTKQELEDLYLPYKPKRRTRAQIARERGLEPLADLLLAGAAGAQDPAALAAAFVADERGVADAESAVAGARDILAERLAENAEVRARLRDSLRTAGVLSARVLSGKEEEGRTYRDYFAHAEAARTIASHRLLAIDRGEREGILFTDLAIADEPFVAWLGTTWKVDLGTPCGREVAAATADSYQRLLRPSVTHEVRSELRERAEAEAIGVFRANLESLLLQSPFGQYAVVGLDPGLRTGCKLAVVDPTGRVVATDVLRLVDERPEAIAAAARRLVDLARAHAVRAVAVGNGTAGRETERAARAALRAAGLAEVIVAIVPETGASVYSASEVARQELPDLDVSLRGAASIARRLQDPLAELVKIEPRSLGVGQYQHDLEPRALARELDLAVEGVVNRVGVELNSASPALLGRVSGLSSRLAAAIVARRDAHGPFRSRRELLEVPGLGPKTFEQAAGFLRLRDGSHPLDRTAVHPERYSAIEQLARSAGLDLVELVGNPARVAALPIDSLLDERSGMGRFTLADIRAELERPGRDPRPDFVAPAWRDDVATLDDLVVGMVLEGRVSNVTNFGAFVDIGVKRDGLVHLSELSTRWIADPREAVRVGEVVKVMVKEVDRERGRVQLSIKALAAPATRGESREGERRSATPKPAPTTARPQPTVADLARKFSRR